MTKLTTKGVATNGILGLYKNGNYSVVICSDGTKLRFADVDEFRPTHPESIDLLITKSCDLGCPMCHEDARPEGKHGDILNLPFLDTMLPHTEIAIGGGNPLEHPDLDEFLVSLRDRRLIANITVNQKHFMMPENRRRLRYYMQNGLLYGIGISLTEGSGELIGALSEFPTAVIHVIEGYTPIEEIRKLYGIGMKILILGYKTFRRGSELYHSNGEIAINGRRWHDAYLRELMEQGGFSAISFDNLAIRHLELKDRMNQSEWSKFYMGDDGQFTMYVDAVNRRFSQNSTSYERYDMLDDIKEMFAVVSRSSSRGESQFTKHKIT